MNTGSEGISPAGDMSFGGLSSFRNGDRRQFNTFGRSMGTGLNGGFNGTLDTPRDEMAPGTMPQPLTRDTYSQMSQNMAQNSAFAQRPTHSATASFQESQGYDRYGSMDLNANSNRLQLHDGGFSQPMLQRPPYMSHSSYDSTLSRRYPNINDSASYVPNYGLEANTDLSMAYRARISDGIPSADYNRVESPFYTGIENAAVQYGQDLNAPVAALERRLRGIQLEQEYLQNPLNRLPYQRTIDFGSANSRMNGLSGYYPAQLGGLGLAQRQRDPDPNQVVRSPLLEEFRANSKGNKRYELKVSHPCGTRMTD